MALSPLLEGAWLVLLKSTEESGRTVSHSCMSAWDPMLIVVAVCTLSSTFFADERLSRALSIANKLSAPPETFLLAPFRPQKHMRVGLQ